MQSRMAIITFTDGAGGAGPDNSLPSAPTYPSQGLPPGAVQLPVFPFDPTAPDQGLPAQPGHPSHPIAPAPGTPTHPIAPGGGGHPSHPIAPGGRFIVKWLACHGLILVPDNTLPPAPPGPTPKA